MQALAGVLLPSATVFLLLLCNDRAVLGPWSCSRLNALAAVIIGVLVELSGTLVTTTLFTHRERGGDRDLDSGRSGGGRGGHRSILLDHALAAAAESATSAYRR